MQMQTGNVAASSIDCDGRMGQSRRLRQVHRLALLALLVAAWLLAGCGAPAPVRLTPPAAAPGSTVPPLPAADFSADPAALVIAERNAAAARDLATLATLWNADARLVEARGARGAQDDYTWQGRAAILDRYAVAVFPNPPPPWEDAPQLQATVTGDSATLQNGVDDWQFVRRDGRWWITELKIEN